MFYIYTVPIIITKAEIINYRCSIIFANSKFFTNPNYKIWIFSTRIRKINCYNGSIIKTGSYIGDGSNSVNIYCGLVLNLTFSEITITSYNWMGEEGALFTNGLY